MKLLIYWLRSQPTFRVLSARLQVGWYLLLFLEHFKASSADYCTICTSVLFTANCLGFLFYWFLHWTQCCFPSLGAGRVLCSDIETVRAKIICRALPLHDMRYIRRKVAHKYLCQIPLYFRCCEDKNHELAIFTKYKTRHVYIASLMQTREGVWRTRKCGSGFRQRLWSSPKLLRVFASGYVNMASVLCFFYKIYDKDSAKYW